MKKLITTISFVLAGAIPFLANAQMMGWGNGWGMNGYWGGGSWIMAIIGIIFWVVIIIGIVYLIRWLLMGGHQRWESHNSGIDILKQRYAKGEISKEEFEEKMKDLMK